MVVVPLTIPILIIRQAILNTAMNKQSSSIHIFDLDGAKPQFQSVTGSRTIMNADNFPILRGMGAVLLRLQKAGVREPHWHANAAELSYCITVNAKMTIYSPNARRDTFTINPGQLLLSREDTGTTWKTLVIMRQNLLLYIIMNVQKTWGFQDLLVLCLHEF